MILHIKQQTFLRTKLGQFGATPRRFVPAAPIVLASIVVATFTAPLSTQAQNARPVTSHVAQTNTQSDAQASLLANSVDFDGQKLIASGTVEVFFGDTRLEASRIIFDQASGALTIEGPIKLTQGSGGDTVILASAATLDPDLRNGVLTSARVVIDQQLQLASAQVDRIEGRYTRLGRTVTSACRICEDNPVPVWQIRAKEVIHDSVERQLYFSNAQFRLWDVPVFYLPHLRLPDPTLERASGFLVPELSNSSNLGTGLTIPYFIPIGDHQDITVSPFFASHIQSVELKYRRAYINGTLEANGAITNEDDTDEQRGYAFIEGEWSLSNRWSYGLDLKATSDISYLIDYDVYDLDRLPSTLWVNSYAKDQALDASLTYIKTLRESEVDEEDTLPFLLGDTSYEKQYTLGKFGGTAWIGASAAGHYRTSNDDIDGMDVLRVSADAGWANSYILPVGLRVDAQTSLTADTYYIAQNSNYDSNISRLTPAASLRLSYPLDRRTATGANQTLTPIVQLNWADTFGGSVPNSDSTLTEFDEGNLYALSQYSGADWDASGATAAVGLTFAHVGSDLDYTLTLGRIFSYESSSDYSESSGLSTDSSDILLAASARLPLNLSLDSRALFDTDLSLTKWETRFDLSRPRYSIGAVHAFVIADADEDRDDDVSELAIEGSADLSNNWTVDADYRFNFDDDIATTAGFNLTYTSECTKAKLGINRRYTDTDDLDPTTSYSFSMGFGAFGAGSDRSNLQCGS